MELWLQMKIKIKYRTQRAFAQACGKSDVWVSEIVNGIRKPNNEEKRLIGEALGFDETDVLLWQE